MMFSRFSWWLDLKLFFYKIEIQFEDSLNFKSIFLVELHHDVVLEVLLDLNFFLIKLVDKYKRKDH